MPNPIEELMKLLRIFLTHPSNEIYKYGVINHIIPKRRTIHGQCEAFFPKAVAALPTENILKGPDQKAILTAQAEFIRAFREEIREKRKDLKHQQAELNKLKQHIGSIEENITLLKKMIAEQAGIGAKSAIINHVVTTDNEIDNLARSYNLDLNPSSYNPANQTIEGNSSEGLKTRLEAVKAEAEATGEKPTLDELVHKKQLDAEKTNDYLTTVQAVKNTGDQAITLIQQQPEQDIVALPEMSNIDSSITLTSAAEQIKQLDVFYDALTRISIEQRQRLNGETQQLETALEIDATDDGVDINVTETLTDLHNQVGELAQREFCYQTVNGVRALSPTFVKLACEEQHQLTADDTPILDESTLRSALQEAVAQTARTTPVNFEKICSLAKQLAQLHPTDKSTATQLLRQHQQSLWQELGKIDHTNKEKILELLFLIDLSLPEKRTHARQTLFFGYSQAMQAMFGRTCSQEAQLDLFSFSRKQRGKDHVNYEEAFADWLTALPKDNSTDPFSTDETETATAAEATKTFHSSEVRLIRLLTNINKCFNSSGQLDTSKTKKMKENLERLLTIAQQHAGSIDGLERVIACRAAFEWMDIVYQLTCHDKAFIINREGNITQTQAGSKQFRQPCLHLRDALAKLRFMIEGDVLDTSADAYAWRRVQLASVFQRQYAELLYSAAIKMSSDESSQPLTDRLVAAVDLCLYQDMHKQERKELPEDIKPTVQMLLQQYQTLEKLSSENTRDTQSAQQQFDAALASDRSMKAGKTRSIKNALEIILPESVIKAFKESTNHTLSA